MKRSIFLSITALFLISNEFSQTRDLAFTAIDSATYVQLDSIKVMNRTQVGDTVLYYPDTVLMLNYQTGVIETNIITWIIAIFGAITFFPLFGAQLVMIIKPNGQKVKDLIIGKGKDWRDRTHFKTALAFAWADLTIILPLFLLGTILVFNGQLWGYVIWISLGILSIYFSIVFWVLEKEYTYKSVGWIAYFTYFWGFFLYWGLGVIIHSVIQMSN